jgi:hypothetical protein
MDREGLLQEVATFLKGHPEGATMSEIQEAVKARHRLVRKHTVKAVVDHHAGPGRVFRREGKRHRHRYYLDR